MKSKRLIHEHTGVFPISFSCPGGRYDKRVIKIAKTLGYKKIFTSVPEYVSGKNNNCFCQGRIMITNVIENALFKKIIEGKTNFIKKKKREYLLKNSLKWVVGNRIYHHIFQRFHNE